MFDRLRIAWQLLRLPGDVIHKLRLYEQVWGVDAAAVVTTLVRRHKLRQWPCSDEQTTHTEAHHAHSAPTHLR